MQRRHFLSWIGAAGALTTISRYPSVRTLASDAPDSSAPPTPSTVPSTPDVVPDSPETYTSVRDGIVWFDVAKLPIEGRVWNQEPRFRTFDRFPSRAEKILTPGVWGNSRHSAGMVWRFLSDAPAFHIHYRLLSDRVAMTHMPATGVSGFDLYARDESGALRWVEVTRPTKREDTTKLTDGLAPGKREYWLYFPLYNGVDSLEIGIPEGDATLEPLAPRNTPVGGNVKPILMYGTSILHGGCAARPGMPHPAILGRRLDWPVLNFGFSGAARMETPLAELFAELDPMVYVLDPLPNMDPELVRERARPFIEILRTKRPETPIVLVEDRPFTNAWIHPQKLRFHEENHRALRQTYETLVKNGMERLWYVPGDSLFGDDHDGAVDGSHATDLGFYRQADVLEPVLRESLGLE
ncbi:MAG: SGNH/GDSL hydrolase family protein [Planctomycetia bacterium]|nr:SGNH/GDSL hydrolase family protein [Planctomycetia bacterium]